MTSLNSPVDAAEMPRKADAARFHFTHDILSQTAAIANVMAQLKPGARVAASGLNWASMTMSACAMLSSKSTA